MENIDLMWIAYFDLPDKDQSILEIEINTIANKTDLSVLESMYLLWKMGRFMNANPGVIG